MVGWFSGRQLAPLRVSGFRLLFLSTLGSSLGTLIAAIALAIDVKDRTNSGLWVGAVLIVEFLPTIFVGLTLGPLLDRFERRKLMIGADLVRVAVFCALPFATSPGAIVALAAVAGLANGFFRPAVYAGVPNLVPEEELPEANALLQTVENVSWMIGPILGGLLTAASGPNAAYWINAVSFLISAALVARIPARKLQSATALSRGHWTDLTDGFKAVLHSRALMAVLVAWGIASFGIGAANVAEIFLAKNVFNAGDFGYGLLYGAIGAGLVFGSFLSSFVVERIGTARTYGGALALDGRRLRRRRDQPERLGRGGLLRRRRPRRRRGDRLQRAARAGRRAGSDARACADAGDERDVPPHRDRHRARRCAAPPGRRPVGVGRSRRSATRSRRWRATRSRAGRRMAVDPAPPEPASLEVPANY